MQLAVFESVKELSFEAFMRASQPTGSTAPDTGAQPASWEDRKAMLLEQMHDSGRVHELKLAEYPIGVIMCYFNHGIFSRLCVSGFRSPSNFLRLYCDRPSRSRWAVHAVLPVLDRRGV
jgi:hypothetical protein